MAGLPITTNADLPPKVAIMGELHEILSFPFLLHTVAPVFALSARICALELFWY